MYFRPNRETHTPPPRAMLRPNYEYQRRGRSFKYSINSIDEVQGGEQQDENTPYKNTDLLFLGGAALVLGIGYLLSKNGKKRKKKKK